MKKYENFKSALKKLKDIYNCQEPYENVEIAGMVGLYEICFEQAWKAIAMDIINQTKNVYYDMFIRLSQTIEKNWM